MFATGDIDASQLRSGSAELHHSWPASTRCWRRCCGPRRPRTCSTATGELQAKWDAASAEMKGRIIDEW